MNTTACVAELVLDVQKHEDATRQSDSETDHIDYGITFVL